MNSTADWLKDVVHLCSGMIPGMPDFLRQKRINCIYVRMSQKIARMQLLRGGMQSGGKSKHTCGKCNIL